MTSPHYKAFISYSHHDEAWARWLQHSLERYRVPRRLVGTEGQYGPIPRRLNPIFRDREDLSSASDLTHQIRTELGAAETLIVICSPSSVASPWVNQEIRSFREMGGGDRILALIVDGDPQATDPASACFPEALVESSDGVRNEPLAADVRKYADGKTLSRLKLVAGILGIRLDELRRRDAQRTTRNRVAIAFSTVLLAALVGWLIHSEATTRAVSQAQRANTEELLEFMLGDLKDLDPIAGLETVDLNDETQHQLEAQFNFDIKDSEQLVSEALAWRDEGMALHQRGELEPAMKLFEQSRAALIDLHQREGPTQRALFELGQAEFWVGYIHLDKGELDLAENAFVRYGVLTRRLVNTDPKNAGMVMELSYTLMNLGALEQMRPDPDSDRSLELIQSAVQYNQMGLILDPGNTQYRQNLGGTLAWLADAWLDVCALGNAFKYRTQSIAILRELFLESPTDLKTKMELANSLSGLAGVQRQMGLNEEAKNSMQESVGLFAELLQAEPDNSYLEWQVVYRSERLAQMLISLGDEQQAWQIYQSVIDRVRALAESNATENTDQLIAVEAARFTTNYSRLLIKRGEVDKGEVALSAAVTELAALVREKPDFRDSVQQLAQTSFGYWRHFKRSPDDGTMELLQGFLSNPETVRSCSDASTAALLAILNGDRELARQYTQYALEKGYFETNFVSFCTEFELCNAVPGNQ